MLTVSGCSCFWALHVTRGSDVQALVDSEATDVLEGHDRSRNWAFTRFWLRLLRDP